MYIDGAYWACRPAMRSSARGSDRRLRERRNCRSSSARLSSRWVSTRSAPTDTPGQRYSLGKRSTVVPGQRRAGLRIRVVVWRWRPRAGGAPSAAGPEPRLLSPYGIGGGGGGSPWVAATVSQTTQIV